MSSDERASDGYRNQTWKLHKNCGAQLGGEAGVVKESSAGKWAWGSRDQERRCRDGEWVECQICHLQIPSSAKRSSPEALENPAGGTCPSRAEPQTRKSILREAQRPQQVFISVMLTRRTQRRAQTVLPRKASQER
jgi:hypothetical protein